MLSVNESNFENVVLSSQLPVLVKAYADWCPPCRRITPLVEALAEKIDHRAVVVKLDVDATPQLAARLHIDSIPAFVVFRNGDEIARMVGVQTEQRLMECSILTVTNRLQRDSRRPVPRIRFKSSTRIGMPELGSLTTNGPDWCKSPL